MSKIFEEPTTQALFKEAMSEWGSRPQLIKTMEECAELTVEIAKYVNNVRNMSVQNIIDEIADVMILTHQMRDLFGHAEVDEAIRRKLSKMEAAIAAARSAQTFEGHDVLEVHSHEGCDLDENLRVSRDVPSGVTISICTRCHIRLNERAEKYEGRPFPDLE